jgi:hypothetical protein
MDHDAKTSVAKAGTAWFGVLLAHLGINSWSDAAAVLATIYSAILIFEWIWKKLKGKKDATHPGS